MSKKYEGVLGKKRSDSLNIDEEDPPEHLAEQAIELLEEQVALNVDLDVLMLLKLFEHYGVASWKDLALSLARDHVPGFQYKSPKGRPFDEKCFMTNFFLTVEISKLKASGEASSVDQACRLLRTNDSSWKKRWPDRSKMVQAYKDFKRSRAGVLETLRMMGGLSSTPEWQEIDFKHSKSGK